MFRSQKQLHSIKATKNVNGKPGGAMIEGAYAVWVR